MSRDLACRIVLEADHLNKQDQQKQAEESGGKLYLKTIWVDESETEYVRHWNLYKDREGAARLCYQADQFDVLYSPSTACYMADNYLAIRKAFASSDNMCSEYQDDFIESPVEVCLKFNQVALTPLLVESEVEQLAVKIERVMNMYTQGCIRS